MGEHIKDIGHIEYKGRKMRVELNGPIDLDSGGTIHIHSDTIRIDMSQLDFYKMATQLNLARENLRRMKGDKE